MNTTFLVNVRSSESVSLKLVFYVLGINTGILIQV